MTTSSNTGTTRSLLYYVLTASSFSIGWGIRGNFGHEFGAMIPGALAAIAVGIASGRADWWQLLPYFGMFGALGWSFGGSMSYMQVIAYTHSGDSASVLYGFACLFVIGFLWAFPGGAGTALPAVLGRERLDGDFPAILAVFLAWWLEATFLEPGLARQGYRLDWYDTDWLGALVALATALAYAAIRRRIEPATSLILCMAIGWWAGFLILVVLLGLRMTPPRGDNWAGCLGMVGGLIAYFHRSGLAEVNRAALTTGFLGGIGFAAAAMLKLVEVTSGYETNWHSILEQTTGLFNGLALAVAMRRLVVHAPILPEPATGRRWPMVVAVGFLLLGITYVNLRKNVGTWVGARSMPAAMYGLAAGTWFDLGYLALAVAILVPLLIHLRRPLPLLSIAPLARGTWLYLVLLWWMVVGNFERALAIWTPQRLVTEGFLLVHAAFGSLLIVLVPDRPRLGVGDRPSSRLGLRTLTAIGLVTASLSIAADWAIVRRIYGDRFAGHARLHIRFGPRATTRGPR